MAGKRPTRRKASRTTPKNIASPRELIWPGYALVASELRDGKRILVEDAAHGAPESWSIMHVPVQLVAFLEVGSAESLLGVMRENAWLYRHPLLHAQMEYLNELTFNARLWNRLGWTSHRAKEPDEVAAVWRLLQELVGIHAAGVVWGYRLSWQRRSRPGPKRGLKNPAPATRSDETIDPSTLKDHFELLRDRIRTKLKVSRVAIPGGRAVSPRTRKAISGVAFAVLAESPEIDWSGRRRAEWELPALPSLIDRLFDDDRQRITREDGFPAALAYAVLGALLDVPPTRIRDAIDSERRAWAQFHGKS